MKTAGEFEVTDKGIERVIAVGDYGGYTVELVIPKEVFIEAYKKWIEPQVESEEV